MTTEPEFLLETSEFVDVLTDIGEIVSDDFSEDEVQMVFLNEGYFQRLGYERIGVDLRSEQSVESGIIDYVTCLVLRQVEEGYRHSLGDIPSLSP